MTDTLTKDAEVQDHSYDGRRSDRRGDAGAAVEVRVRAERRRPSSDEDKLRIVRETLAAGAVEGRAAAAVVRALAKMPFGAGP